MLLANLGEAEACYLLPVLRALRKRGIAAMMYPDAAKLKKQLAFADTRRIPYVVIAGSSEMDTAVITLKNMTTGEQETIDKERFAEQWN